MNIIIPMAGLGSRFNNKYHVPKPLIDVNGSPMIKRAVESLDLHGKWHFVIQDNQHTDAVRKVIYNLQSNSLIKVIDCVTEGPACSALLFRQEIDLEDELVIANCDQIMEWNGQRFLDYVRYYDGAVVTYHNDTDKNSYARLDSRGFVTEIREKEVISNVSLNGIHYWKKARYFVESAQQMIDADDRAPNGEFYIGPSYNYMINKGLKVGIYHIPNQQHHAVGVPLDLEIFLAYENSKNK